MATASCGMLKRTGRFLMGILLIVLMCGIAPSQSLAITGHHGGEADDGECARNLGDYVVRFSAYQPQIDPDGHYCFEIPGTGKTYVVIDLVGDELKAVPTSLMIVKVSTEADGGKKIFESAPEIRKHGVIDSVADYEPGVYEAVVRAHGQFAIEQKMRFVIGVPPPGGGTASYLTVAVAVILLGALGVVTLRGKLAA